MYLWELMKSFFQYIARLCGLANDEREANVSMSDDSGNVLESECGDELVRGNNELQCENDGIGEIEEEGIVAHNNTVQSCIMVMNNLRMKAETLNIEKHERDVIIRILVDSAVESKKKLYDRLDKMTDEMNKMQDNISGLKEQKNEMKNEFDKEMSAMQRRNNELQEQNNTLKEQKNEMKNKFDKEMSAMQRRNNELREEMMEMMALVLRNQSRGRSRDGSEEDYETVDSWCRSVRGFQR